MVIVKILGTIDIIAGLILLAMLFGISPPVAIILFASGLLLTKSLFVLTGDVLSIVDLLTSIILLTSLLFTLPILFYWTFALLLFAKGIISYV